MMSWTPTGILTYISSPSRLPVASVSLSSLYNNFTPSKTFFAATHHTSRLKRIVHSHNNNMYRASGKQANSQTSAAGQAIPALDQDRFDSYWKNAAEMLKPYVESAPAQPALTHTLPGPGGSLWARHQEFMTGDQSPSRPAWTLFVDALSIHSDSGREWLKAAEDAQKGNSYTADPTVHGRTSIVVFLQRGLLGPYHT